MIRRQEGRSKNRWLRNKSKAAKAMARKDGSKKQIALLEGERPWLVKRF
jgi:hypothetical protein